MIIKVYGEYWSRNRVDWTTRKLVGKMKGKRAFDGWNQRGIYALYNNFEIVYVGQADSRGLGVRLSEHLTDRFGERWDSFSFFGICELDAKGAAKRAAEVTVGPSSVIRSLELMAILLSDARLNRARGRFPDGAEKAWQVEPERPSKNYQLDEKLRKIVSDVENLRDSLAAKNRKAAKEQLD